MENFLIKGSTYIPTINFDAQNSVLEISGESYHEYTIEFFQPIFEWLNGYLAEPNKSFVFNFKMTYFNTSSSRRFLEIFDLLENYVKNKHGKVEVNWYYKEGDLDMLESGEEYADDVDLKFNFISYP
jgi:SiaC family regulatory phosphoprotein